MYLCEFTVRTALFDAGLVGLPDHGAGSGCLVLLRSSACHKLFLVEMGISTNERHQGRIETQRVQSIKKVSICGLIGLPGPQPGQCLRPLTRSLDVKDGADNHKW